MLANNNGDERNGPEFSDGPSGRVNRPVLNNASDILQSHIIIGFEEALRLGLSPSEALGQVLAWAAAEMTRINSKTQPQSNGVAAVR